MPGRAFNTPRCSRSSINSCWLNKHGRGPTRLISPHNTFHNCGNSSSLVLRKKPPKGVIALLLAKWLATCAVSGFMVLNFTSIKGFLCRPTRCWRNIGEPVSNKPITVKITSTGKPNTRPQKAKIISNKRINIIPLKAASDN